MIFLLKFLRLLWFSIWYVFAVFVVLVAAVFGIVRLLLPLVGEYNLEIEKQATAYVGRPIKIMSLDAEWHGFSPSLVLNNVRVLNAEGNKTILQFARARLDFSLVKSMKSREVSFERLALSGVDLSLIRQKTGQISLLGFDEDSSTDASGGDKEFLAEWIFGQGEISLEAKNLLYYDEQSSNRRYHFTDVSLMIRNRNARHLVDGVIVVPGKSPQELVFSLDIQGDFISLNDWSGQFYVKGTNLDFNRVVGALEFDGLSVGIGPSDFELWGRWDQWELSKLQGDVSLHDLALATSDKFQPILKSLLSNNLEKASKKDGGELQHKSNVHYDQVIGRFDWEKSVDGWHLAADQFMVAYNKKRWPSSQFSINYARDQHLNASIAVNASLVRLQDLMPVTPILFGRGNSYIQRVYASGLQGDLTDLRYIWNEVDKRFNFSSKFDALHLMAADSYPGVKDFSGEVEAVNNKGRVTLYTTDAVLDFPKVFREAIIVKDFNGNVSWHVQKDKVVISSRDIQLNTQDIATKAILDLDIPTGSASPFISLIMNFNNGDARATSTYLPVSIMSASTVEWLDNAILQGHVVSGGAILYGRLDEFPFTQGQGVFETRFSFENGVLDYAENWPRVHDISADVLFRGDTLTIESNHAKIFNNKIDAIHVDIPNLAEKSLRLNISGKAHGSSQEKLNYLLMSPPLRENFGKYLSDIKLYGESDLALDIKLEFGDELTSSVTGSVAFYNNRLDLSRDKLLTNASGTVILLEDGVEASGIKADFLGQPGVVNIVTSRASKSQLSKSIKISAKGEFDAQALSENYFPVLNDLISGKSDWFANVLLPGFQENQKRDDSVRLSIESSLNGIELNLPPPFKKPADQSRQLKIRVDLKDLHNVLIRTSYGGGFDGIFEYDMAKSATVTRGELRFGSGQVALPKGKGVRVSGSMDELPLDIWLNLLSQVDRKKSLSDRGKSSMLADSINRPLTSLLHSLDLFVGKFEAFGQKAMNMSLKVENKQDWLLADIKSKEISGQLKIPNDLKNDAVVMDLQYWHLTSSDASAGIINPKYIPALSLNSRSVTYDNRKFGHVAIEAAKSANGLLLQQIIIKSKQTILKGHGAWDMMWGKQNSSIEFMLESDDLGTTMKDLGFVGTIDNGVGVFNAKLRWPGSLIDIDLEHLEGNIDFKLTDGRILDLEPGGAARLFGLFSLQTLPRRLILDFSDVFSRGLGFDLIEGEFRIEDGDAYTRNFRLQGPNANIELKGRVGLATQDYDQKITVTPHITDATILLSVITSQPLLFFLQQLMKEDIEKATSLEYSLTGPWDNFKLEPILQKKSVDIMDSEEF